MEYDFEEITDVCELNTVCIARKVDLEKGNIISM